MKTILVDSQLLLLLIVGSASRTFISKHKRLAAYTEADFDLLNEFLEEYAVVIVTPHVLTETSNLLGQIGEPIRTNLYRKFRTFLKSLDERTVESALAADRTEFVRLGLADVASLSVAETGAALLTDDFDLYMTAAREGRDVTNFAHIRQRRGNLGT